MGYQNWSSRTCLTFNRCLDVTRDMIASVFIIKRIEWLKTSAALKCFKTDKHNFRANTIHRFLHIMTKNPRALIASLSWLSSSSFLEKKTLKTLHFTCQYQCLSLVICFFRSDPGSQQRHHFAGFASTRLSVLKGFRLKTCHSWLLHYLPVNKLQGWCSEVMEINSPISI